MSQLACQGRVSSPLLSSLMRLLSPEPLSLTAPPCSPVNASQSPLPKPPPPAAFPEGPAGASSLDSPQPIPLNAVYSLTTADGEPPAVTSALRSGHGQTAARPTQMSPRPVTWDTARPKLLLSPISVKPTLLFQLVEPPNLNSFLSLTSSFQPVNKTRQLQRPRKRTRNPPTAART